MAFEQADGIKGKIYIPERSFKNAAKHPCKDCFSCQFCSDDRCALCRPQKEPAIEESNPK